MQTVTINTSFGNITFQYLDDSELSQKLDEIESQITLIGRRVKQLLPRAQRLPKPGFELSYRFTPNGQVELLHYPSQKTKIVALALYAYHPEMVSISELENVTGIEDILAKVLGQTLNKKYFRRDDDSFGLSQEGINLISEVLPPSLPKPAIPEDVVGPKDEVEGDDE